MSVSLSLLLVLVFTLRVTGLQVWPVLTRSVVDNSPTYGERVVGQIVWRQSAG